MLASAERAGSTDSGIEKEGVAYEDIEQLVERHPTISRIVLTPEAATLFKRGIKKGESGSKGWRE